MSLIVQQEKCRAVFNKTVQNQLIRGKMEVLRIDSDVRSWFDCTSFIQALNCFRKNHPGPGFYNGARWPWTGTFLCQACPCLAGLRVVPQLRGS